MVRMRSLRGSTVRAQLTVGAELGREQDRKPLRGEDERGLVEHEALERGERPCNQQLVGVSSHPQRCTRTVS